MPSQWLQRVPKEAMRPFAPPYRFQAKRQHLERLYIPLPGGQGRNLASTVLHVPYSLDSGQGHNLASTVLHVPYSLDRGRQPPNLGAYTNLVFFFFFFFFFFTLVTDPRRSLNLKLSDTRVYEPHIRAPRRHEPGAAARTEAARGALHPNLTPSTLNPQPSTLNPEPHHTQTSHPAP